MRGGVRWKTKIRIVTGQGGGRVGGKSKRWLKRRTVKRAREVGTATCERLGVHRLAFQADLVNRVHYFLVISFYNSSLLS